MLQEGFQGEEQYQLEKNLQKQIKSLTNSNYIGKYTRSLNIII